MCDVTLLSDGVQIEPTGWEHAGGLVGRFVVPLADINQVSTAEDPLSLVRGWRVGVGLPKTRIGTWHHDGVVDYICVHRAGAAIVLDLAPGGTYARVVVTVDDPEELASQIRGQMA